MPGAVLGCVPQCGFSAIASNFYASRVITLGTLMAVYLATSDEAIPLLVSMPAYWDKLILLMVIKVVYAVFVGFLLDFVLRKACPAACAAATPATPTRWTATRSTATKRAIPSPSGRPRSATPSRSLSLSSCSALCSASSSRASARMSRLGAGPDGLRSSRWWPHWLALSQLCRQRPDDQLHVEAQLRFSSLVAGLCTGAGVGLAVLWRVNPSWKQNLFITGLTWACGAAVGVGIQIVVAFIA